jgi:hypothetical protein
VSFIHKTKAIRTIVDGITFPSKLHATLYAELKLRERAHEISELEMEHAVELTKANLRYKIDFSYFDNKTFGVRFAEAKGIETDRWKILVKLWPHYGPAPLDIYKANSRGIYLAETITP